MPKKKFKPSMIPIYVILAIAIITVAFLIVGGAYLWHYSLITKIDTLEQNQAALELEIKKAKPEADKKVEEVDDEVDGEDEIGVTDKVFEGDGFSFIYPEKFIADEKGLWTKEGYDRHINPSYGCDTCQIPEIEIKSVSTSISLEKYILSDYDLPGNTLKEMTKQINIPYSTMNLGDNEFIKITVGDMYNLTGYYTKDDKNIVAFRVYFDSRDTSELREIISSLKFD